MIDIKEIEKEIEMLENSECTTYPVCQKLAILYTVREGISGKGTASSISPLSKTSTSSGPPQPPTAI